MHAFIHDSMFFSLTHAYHTNFFSIRRTVMRLPMKIAASKGRSAATQRTVAIRLAVRKVGASRGPGGRGFFWKLEIVEGNFSWVALWREEVEGGG